MRKERIECTMLNCCRVVVLKYYLSINFESELLNDLHGFSTVGDMRGQEAESLDRWAGKAGFQGVLPRW